MEESECGHVGGAEERGTCCRTPSVAHVSNAIRRGECLRASAASLITQRWRAQIEVRPTLVLQHISGQLPRQRNANP